MEYESSGDGYWHVKGDPSRGSYGIPPEVEKEIEEKWIVDSFLNEERNKLRKIKALNLIRKAQGRDIKFKIDFLKKLGYSHANISNGEIDFEHIKEKDYPNISRFYDRTIEGLREIIKNPGKESKLIKRLDSFQ